MLTLQELKYLEKLSKIEIEKEQEHIYTKKISHILEYIDMLSEVKTDHVKPTSQVTNLENGLRNDIVGESLTQKEVLMNSLYQYKGYFKVPKVIE